MNPAVNPFSNINISSDLIETLRDPLQKHLHFGPSYSSNNENNQENQSLTDFKGFLGKNTKNLLGHRDIGLFQDRTNEEYGANMMYGKYNNEDTLKNKMFRNALDSVQLPKTKMGNNVPMTGISNFDEFDNLF